MEYPNIINALNTMQTALKETKQQICVVTSVSQRIAVLLSIYGVDHVVAGFSYIFHLKIPIPPMEYDSWKKQRKINVIKVP